jgi:hypothetical protein
MNFSIQGEADCWSFIQGLNWLQPSLATSPTIRDCDEYHANLPSRIVSHKDTLWLYKRYKFINNFFTLANKL